jgi:hypothetical protein
MHDKQETDVNKPACDATLSRKDFLTKLVQRAAVAGSLIAAPKIIDKFLVPPAQALNSTTTVHDTTGVHDQTQHFHDSHAPLRPPNTHNGNSHDGNSHGGNTHSGGNTHDGGSSTDSTPEFDKESGWG